MSDTPEMKDLGIDTLLSRAIAARAFWPESVWLASSAAEAAANANLFAKTQMPLTDPERKRSLIRAFNAVKKSRGSYG